MADSFIAKVTILFLLALSIFNCNFSEESNDKVGNSKETSNKEFTNNSPEGDEEIGQEKLDDGNNNTRYSDTCSEVLSILGKELPEGSSYVTDNNNPIYWCYDDIQKITNIEVCKSLIPSTCLEKNSEESMLPYINSVFSLSCFNVPFIIKHSSSATIDILVNLWYSSILHNGSLIDCDTYCLWLYPTGYQQNAYYKKLGFEGIAVTVESLYFGTDPENCFGRQKLVNIYLSELPIGKYSVSSSFPSGTFGSTLYIVEKECPIEMEILGEPCVVGKSSRGRHNSDVMNYDDTKCEKENLCGSYDIQMLHELCPNGHYEMGLCIIDEPLP